MDKEKLIRLIDEMTEKEVIDVGNYIEFMRMKKIKKGSKLEENTINIGEEGTCIDNKRLSNDKNSNEDKKRNSYCQSGFIMGLLSIFLNDIGILPLATIVVSISLSQVIVGIFFCHFFESEFNTPGDTLGT